MLYKRRGGLSTIVATLVLIAIVMAAIVGVAYYSRRVSTGAMKGANLIWEGTQIKLSMTTGKGTVTIAIYNSGPGPVRIANVTIATKTTPFVISFTTLAPFVTATIGNATLSGSSGVGTASDSGTTVLGIPAGANLSIIVTVGAVGDLRTYFSVGGTYEAKATAIDAPTYMLEIDANSV